MTDEDEQKYGWIMTEKCSFCINIYDTKYIDFY